MIKKIAKIILWIFLSFIGLLLLISILVYLPPVQNFIKRKAIPIVERNLDMRISVDRFRIRFPLRLSVGDAKLMTPEGDTLVGFRTFEANISLLPLLRGEVKARRIALADAIVNYSDTISGLSLNGRLGDFAIRSIKANLGNDSIHIGALSLNDAVIDIGLGEGKKTDMSDTLPAKPLLWKIAADNLDLQRVDFRMNLEVQGSELHALLGNANIRKGYVNLGRRVVNAELVRIADGNYSFVNLNSAAAGKRPAADADVKASAPWQISAQRIELENNAFAMQTAPGRPASGFDFAHIDATAINLVADTLNYSGSKMSAYLRSLSLTERSGLEVTGAHGGFFMDSTNIDLSGFELTTPNSDVKADVNIATSLQQMNAAAPFTANIDASVAMQDLLLFYTPEPSLRRSLSGRSVNIRGDLTGTVNDIRINDIAVVMPGSINFRADGRVASLFVPGEITGNINMNGTFTNIGFIRSFLPNSLRNRIGFPNRMTLAGNVRIDRASYLTNLRLTADGGTLSVVGALNTRTQSYNADVKAMEFPLYAFLPSDSLGRLSMELTAEGSGFDIGAASTRLKAGLKVSRLDYSGNQYTDIGLDVSLLEHILAGNVLSRVPDLDFNIDIAGSLYPKNYSLEVNGHINNADFHKLNLSKNPLVINSAPIKASVGILSDSLLKASLRIDSMLLTVGGNTQQIPFTTVVALSQTNSVMASIRSGDLIFDFDAPVSLDSLRRSLGSTTREIRALVADRNLDMEKLQEAMPPYKLDVSAGNNNLLYSFVALRGISFHNITASMSTLDSRPFSANIVAEGFKAAGIVVDTLNVGLERQSDSLQYHLRLANRPGNIDQMALIYVYGSVAGATAHANFYQRNREGVTGFQFGLRGTLLDSAITVNLYPHDPLFAYHQWTANENNYITYGFDNKIFANLRLDRENQHLHIMSDEVPDIPEGGVVRLDMAGINIGELLALLPSPPALEGIMSSDIRLGLNPDIFVIDGWVNVDRFAFNERLLGDVGINVALSRNEQRRMMLDGTVTVNGDLLLEAKGALASPGEENMNLDVRIPGLPLSLANIFVPESTVRLGGTFYGNAEVTGAFSAMNIDGEVYFNQGVVTVPIIGTSFTISDNHIEIAESVVIFDDFSLTAPNNNKLFIDGTVDIFKFGSINTDLELFATDFQIVNSTWREGSQVYGRLNADIDITLRGYLDRLQVRGDIGILRTTNVTYIMRNSPLNVQNRTQDLVTFVSFSDTARLSAIDSTVRSRPSGMDIQVNVDINDGAQTTIYFSEDGNNRVELIGRGILNFTMNNQGDTRLAGSYNISGGTVMYNPPIIPQKVFAINPGSYIQFTGDPTNPSFNIKATQNMRATVDGAQQVMFNVIIMISNTLKDAKITFDLTASGNNAVSIQNQLAALTPEQRSEQALLLMINNTYSGPGGTTGRVNTSNALSSLIQMELNQWARNNLSGVDVSFGVGQRTNIYGDQFTSYSYNVSKTLFDERLRVTIGGDLGNTSATARDVDNNIVRDFELEYRLTRRDNMYLRIYRHNTQPSILEGEVIEMGGGFIVRKRMNRLGELFKFSRDLERRNQRRQEREAVRKLRAQERAATRAERERERSQEPSSPEPEPPQEAPVP